MRNILIPAISATLLAGCVSLDPRHETPALPTPDAWPQGPAYAASTETASGALPAWREFYADPKLQQLIDIALRENRDLRVAALNIERARAAHRIQRSELLPSVNGAVQGVAQQTPIALGGTGETARQYSATVGVTAFELDFFGRVRSLNRAALQNYLATEDARDSAQISLIAEVATLYLSYAGDVELLQLSQDTLTAQQRSLQLTQQRHEAGAASRLDVRRAQSIVERARADVATYTTLVAQDENALALLLGAPVPAELRPTTIDAIQFSATPFPTGLPSDVLLARPDIRASEHQLRAANANIGAARAAFFPRISLAGSMGEADVAFENLFNGADSVWSFTPTITIPIFDAGARRGRLGVAEADRDIAVANYERAVQVAFRETSDALAEYGTMGEQLDAREDLAEAAADTYSMSEARYREGIDNYLGLLDAQRELYAAQQALVRARVQRGTNLVRLYKTLGGGAL